MIKSTNIETNMQVTLRQAHKIEEKINAVLAKINLNAMQTFSVYSSIDDDALAKARANFDEQYDRHTALLHARQQVRNSIRDVNRFQVDSLVAQRKNAIDNLKVLQHLQSTIPLSPITTIETLKAKVEAVRHQTKNSSYVDDSVTFCMFSEVEQKQLQQQIQSAQLRVEQIEDQLTTANASRDHTIALSKFVIELLRTEGIIE